MSSLSLEARKPKVESHLGKKLLRGICHHMPSMRTGLLPFLYVSKQ